MPVRDQSPSPDFRPGNELDEEGEDLLKALQRSSVNWLDLGDRTSHSTTELLNLLTTHLGGQRAEESAMDFLARALRGLECIDGRIVVLYHLSNLVLDN